MGEESAIEKEEATPINVAGAAPALVVERGGEELKLVLGEFAGPLDLLLYLIRQERVNIYDIPIARITDEYLRYLRLMQELDIAVAGEFLVMAATLLEIKSRMLLPREPSADSQGAVLEEDPRQELVARLLEYQKYKAAAQMLWSKATIEQAIFTRAPLETDEQNPEIAATVFDLFRVFQQILARRRQEVLLEIERDEARMTDMIERMSAAIEARGELNLREFFETLRSRRELVLAFLAVLELVRTAAISLIQREIFGDIIARRVERSIET